MNDFGNLHLDISATSLFCLLSPGKFLSNMGVIRHRNKLDIFNDDPFISTQVVLTLNVGVIKHSNQLAPYLIHGTAFSV